MFRSTKGASKQRRNLINAEICALRDLLPVSECSRQRLSQLQVMCLTCVYIRKCHYFDKLFSNDGSDSKCLFNFFQAMPGFLMVVTRDGKLLYVSENVTEYLGHSMMDMVTQGDSVYDFIDKKDHEKVRSNLLVLNPGFRCADGDDGPRGPSAESLAKRTGVWREERVFFCRMNVARSCRRQTGPSEHKTIRISGHFVHPVVSDCYPLQPIFVAICCPLISPDIKDSVLNLNTMIFYSTHHLDMKYIEISRNGQYHLGYTEEELMEVSWYSLLHPQDLNDAATRHMQLIKSSQETGSSVLVRMQTKPGSWIWINTLMNIQRSNGACDNSHPAIVCVNHVTYDSESQQLRLDGDHLSMYPASSPESLSQGCTTILPQAIAKHSTGSAELGRYESNAAPWASSAAEQDFSRDNRVPAYASNRRSLTAADRCRAAEVFPEYSADLRRLNCMNGSLLEQLRSDSGGRRTRDVIPSSARSTDVIRDRRDGHYASRSGETDYEQKHESSGQRRDSVRWRIFDHKAEGHADSSWFVSEPAFSGHDADWNGYTRSDYYLSNHNETIYNREPAFSC